MAAETPNPVGVSEGFGFRVLGCEIRVLGLWDLRFGVSGLTRFGVSVLIRFGVSGLIKCFVSRRRGAPGDRALDGSWRRQVAP